MFVKIPKGFIPDQDTDQMHGHHRSRAGHLVLPDGGVRSSRSPRSWPQIPNVESLMASVGGATASTLGGPNYGQLVVHLKPRTERKLGVERHHQGTAAQARRASPGMQIYLQNPPTIRIGGQVTKSLYQFSMQSPDKDELYAEAEKLDAGSREAARRARTSPTTSPSRTPQVNVTIDRDKAGAMQVNANQIENALYDAYGPRWVSTIYGSVNEYKVLLELEAANTRPTRARFRCSTSRTPPAS